VSGGPFLANLLRFPRLLRRAGIPVSLDQGRRFVAALELMDLGDRQQVFFTARATLVTRRQDLALFAALFARFFHPAAGAVEPPRGRETRPEKRDDAPWLLQALASRRGRPAGPAVLAVDRSGAYSPEEVLRRKDFATLSEDELQAVRRLLVERPWPVLERRVRRRVPHRRGDALDLRRALARAARRGGAVVDLPRRRRKVKARPLVLVADLSGSMERYTRVVLPFFFGLTRRLPRVESFAFATRLTRITPELLARNVDRALAEAARRVVDLGGGTRIGGCLQELRRRWGRRVLGRGAVLLVLSDGWDRGEPERLAHELDRLRRSCHRLIWLNPLAGRVGYEPRVAGMAAALPQVDDFLPAHDLNSLESLAAHLAALPQRRGERSGGAGLVVSARRS
jgi:uncharacterized protein with von Willebrand factor type A (vWA) domain